MIFYAILASFIVLVECGYKHEENHKPQPYSFGYLIKDKEGVQHRDEASDGHGTVKGSYGFYDNKGIRREVEYLADDGGFKAKIRTNEPGTTGNNPASVEIFSNDPYTQGAAVPYNSRVNVPYVPALDLADGKNGFPTVHDFHKYSINHLEEHPATDPNFVGGLVHSNILGAGYRFPKNIVYFGANLVGGRITGHDSRFPG